MLNRLSHTTDTDTRTLEQRAADHARNLDVNAEPIALQRWAVAAKKLIEELAKGRFMSTEPKTRSELIHAMYCADVKARTMVPGPEYEAAKKEADDLLAQIVALDQQASKGNV